MYAQGYLLNLSQKKKIGTARSNVREKQAFVDSCPLGRRSQSQHAPNECEGVFFAISREGQSLLI